MWRQWLRRRRRQRHTNASTYLSNSVFLCSQNGSTEYLMKNIKKTTSERKTFKIKSLKRQIRDNYHSTGIPLTLCSLFENVFKLFSLSSNWIVFIFFISLKWHEEHLTFLWTTKTKCFLFTNRFNNGWLPFVRHWKLHE